MDRRSFVKASVTTSGGLLIGFQLGSPGHALAAGDAIFNPNAWLTIGTDNSFRMVIDKTEMGQGVYSSLAVLMAEELDVDPARFALSFAPADRRYDNPELNMQITGGSTSIKVSFLPLRQAGATAREMLIRAAATRWGVVQSECLTDDGTVTHTGTKQSASYGELAADAAKLQPRDPVLKSETVFKYIGKYSGKLDGKAKVMGDAQFGIDVAVDGMKVAYIVHSPVPGGQVKSFNADQAKGHPGYYTTVVISTGLAVVCDKYWQAKRVAELIKVEWEPGKNASLDSQSMRAAFAAQVGESATNFRDDGDVDLALKTSGRVVEADYFLPYLAHAPMEPMNATAHVQDGRIDVWAPTQAPGLAKQQVVAMTGYDAEQVHIHTTFLGGGFGRRLAQDYVVEAVEVSQATRMPVKVLWSREEEIRHDYYRPASFHKLRAALNADGMPTAWSHVLVAPSILAQMIPTWLPAMTPSWLPEGLKRFLGNTASSVIEWSGKDDTSMEGAKDLPYKIPNVRVDYVLFDPGVPVGFWRSVGHSYTGFVVETFIDQLATEAKKDPFRYRQQLLAGDADALSVLNLVAEKARWDAPLAAGRFRGIACHKSFGTNVAEVAEVSYTDGRLKVERVVAAVNCGLAISPDNVKAQIESGIVFGLSAALFQQVTFKNGTVQESNFHDYQVVRQEHMPIIEVHIVPSTKSPQGVGEPGLPPIAAAVANAAYQATGKRFLELPLQVS